MADSVDGARKLVGQLQDVQDPCGFDARETRRHLEDSLPRWNMTRGVLMGWPLRVYVEIGEGELELELTRKVLEARAAREANGGAWPAAIPGIETSVNPGGHWFYEVSPDGVMTLRFSEGCGVLGATRPASPLEYVSEVAE